MNSQILKLVLSFRKKFGVFGVLENCESIATMFGIIKPVVKLFKNVFGRHKIRIV